MHELRVPIRNTSPAPLTVVVEPWAREVVLAPGSGFDVVLRGPYPPRVELEVSSYGLIVWVESAGTWLDEWPRSEHLP